MSLQTARDTAAALAPKSPGHLITAADWNALVGVLVEYGDALIGLPDRVTAAETALAALEARVDALDQLEARVQTLEDETAPLRENYKLTVRTTAESFLVGQVAEIIFTATALDGRPLSGPRPWLDVFSSWGRLRAAPGFVVRENAEENALSVQFNNAGEVRVQLRSQFTKGFTPANELVFANALNAQAGTTGKTVLQVLKASASPQDVETRTAFKALHASYDTNTTVRAYADGYVSQMAGGKFSAGKIGTLVRPGQWEDYRATVMAFAKPDAAATTADPTRGVATVQVTFREWLGHWSDDYVGTLEPVLPNWSSLLQLNLGRADALPFAVSELDRRARSDGVLGHARNLLAFDKAAGVINPGNDVNLALTKNLLQGAVKMQLATGGEDAGAASSYAQQAHATQQAGFTARAAQATAQDAATAKQSVVLLENRVKAAEQTGREISAGLKNIGDGVNKINVAEVADLGGRLNRINLSLTDLIKKVPGG